MSVWPRYPFWQGRWNWGRPRIPLPGYVAMVDRTTGIDYYLSQTGSPGSMTLALVPWDGTIKQPFHDYGPYGGPYLNGNVRLFINSGVLSAEKISEETAIWDPRIFTRDSAFGRHLLELTVPFSWQNGDPIVFTEKDV